MAPKRKTTARTSKNSARSIKKKSTKSVTESFADLPAEIKLEKNGTIDSDKNVTNSQEGISDTGEFDFDKNSEENNIKPFFPSKHDNQSSESVPSYVSNFKSILENLRNMKIEPSVHMYSIKPEGKGICAVDVSQDNSHLAYSFLHSQEVCLCAKYSLPDHIATNDLRTTWTNYQAARNRLEAGVGSEKDKEVLSPSPQVYVIRHNDNVTGLRFSSDDNILMSCSLDGYVKAISTTTYRVLEHYDGYGAFTDIDVNSDITKFGTANALSCSPFHAAFLYTFERSKPVQIFTGHESPLKCIRFHPNGLYFATAALDRSIKLWSVHQSKEVRHFKDEDVDNINQLTFSPDGKYLASAHDGCVKIWDLASGRKLKCLNTSNSGGRNFCVCYNPDGNMLAAGGSNKQIHFWNITSDESSEKSPEYDFSKSEQLGNTIFSIKSVSCVFSCVTG